MFSGTDKAYIAGGYAKKLNKPFLPLPQEIRTVDQHKGTGFPFGDKRRRNHCFAKSGSCVEYSDILRQHGFYGQLLILAQFSLEFYRQSAALDAFILDNRKNIIVLKQFQQGVQTPTRQAYVLRKVFRATDKPGLIPNRQAHGLRFVKFGIGECRKTDQAIQQGLGNFAFINEYLIGKHQGNA